MGARRYRVSGCRKDDGTTVIQTIAAGSEHEAQDTANRRGVLVAQVEPIFSPWRLVRNIAIVVVVVGFLAGGIVAVAVFGGDDSPSISVEAAIPEEYRGDWHLYAVSDDKGLTLTPSPGLRHCRAGADSVEHLDGQVWAVDLVAMAESPGEDPAAWISFDGKANGWVLSKTRGLRTSLCEVVDESMNEVARFAFVVVPDCGPRGLFHRATEMPAQRGISTGFCGTWVRLFGSIDGGEQFELDLSDEPAWRITSGKVYAGEEEGDVFQVYDATDVVGIPANIVLFKSGPRAWILTKNPGANTALCQVLDRTEGGSEIGRFYFEIQ